MINRYNRKTILNAARFVQVTGMRLKLRTLSHLLILKIKKL